MPLYHPDDAPKSTKVRLRTCPTARALRSVFTEFLVYDAGLADDDVLLLHFPFSWGNGAPQVAAVCSSGLCSAPQPRRRQWCFETFDIAVAFYSAGFSEAFLEQMLLLMRDVLAWLADSAAPALGLGDWVQSFPLLSGLPSALLVPPAPELVQAGLRPYSTLPSELAMRDWATPDALIQAGSHGFLQAVPLFEAEYAHVASTRNGMSFFQDHLLASVEELDGGADAAFRILDMKRKAAV